MNIIFLDYFLAMHVQHFFLALPYGTALIIFFARYIIFLNIALALWLWRLHIPVLRHAIAEAIWILLVSLLVVAGLSWGIDRARPYLAHADIALMIPPPYHTSFPSGHTTTAFALAFVFFATHKKIGSISLAIAGATAIGRMAAGVHYPTDIAGGFLLAVFLFFLLRQLHARLRRRDMTQAVSRHHHV